MRHNDQELDPFSGGGGNGYDVQFFQQLPPGTTIKEIDIIGTNLDSDQIARIEISLNGDTIYYVTGDHLRFVQAYKGEYQEDDRWTIPFADFSAELQDGQNQSSLVILPGENVQFKVFTKAATAAQTGAGSVASIRATAVFGAEQTVRRYVPRMYSDVLQGSVVGENGFSEFVTQQKSKNKTYIRRAHLMSARVAKFEVKRNNVSIFKRNLGDNNYSLRRYGKVPQADTYHFDPIKTNFAKADKLDPGKRKFELITTLNALGAVDVLYETLEELPVAA